MIIMLTTSIKPTNLNLRLYSTDGCTYNAFKIILTAGAIIVQRRVLTAWNTIQDQVHVSLTWHTEYHGRFL